MTEPVAPEGFSLTPTGLPFPESTEALNQGANAIKALALALDTRAGYVIEARTLHVALNAGEGIAVVTFVRPFRVAPTLVFSVGALYTPGSFGSYVPVPGAIEVTTTGFRLLVGAIHITNAAEAVQPWGGGVDVHYIAAGTP